MAAELLDDSDRLAREALLDMSADRIRSPSWQQAPTATHPRAVNVTASCRCGRVPPEHYDHDQDAQNAPRTGRNTRGSLPGATLATRRSGVGVPLAPLCDEALYPARYRMSDPARQGRIAVCCRQSQRECAITRRHQLTRPLNASRTCRLCSAAIGFAAASSAWRIMLRLT